MQREGAERWCLELVLDEEQKTAAGGRPALLHQKQGVDGVGSVNRHRPAESCPTPSKWPFRELR